MRLAYATTYDAGDVHQWSGLGMHIALALEDEGIELSYVNVGPASLPERVVGRAVSKVSRRRYLVDREPHIARRRGRRLVSVLPPDIDVVFSPGTLAIADLHGAPPTAFWTDATFASITDLYPSFSGIHHRTARVANEVEGRALSRCSAAIYTSAWAADSAVTDYGIDGAKVHVVPFGANLGDLPDERQVARSIDARMDGPCRLLFVGVDWQRKGGDLAVETARLLNERGISTELVVVGATPPKPTPPFVRPLGFISKATDAEALRDCYRSAHFLVLPTRAECAAVVFSEASAFGVPSLATDVGGVGAVVRSGVNGELFSLDATPREYADFVEGELPDYRALAMRAFADYHRRLSWKIGAAAVRRILEQVVATRGRGS
jgi:glycosyltransferase involved in cell wall biosynthesis